MSIFEKLTSDEVHQLRKKSPADASAFLLGKGLHPYGFELKGNGKKCNDCVFKRERDFKRSLRIAHMCSKFDQVLNLTWPACSSFVEQKSNVEERV